MAPRRALRRAPTACGEATPSPARPRWPVPPRGREDSACAPRPAAATGGWGAGRPLVLQTLRPGVGPRNWEGAPGTPAPEGREPEAGSAVSGHVCRVTVTVRRDPQAVRREVVSAGRPCVCVCVCICGAFPQDTGSSLRPWRHGPSRGRPPGQRLRDRDPAGPASACGPQEAPSSLSCGGRESLRSLSDAHKPGPNSHLDLGLGCRQPTGRATSLDARARSVSPAAECDSGGRGRAGVCRPPGHLAAVQDPRLWGAATPLLSLLDIGLWLQAFPLSGGGADGHLLGVTRRFPKRTVDCCAQIEMFCPLDHDEEKLPLSNGGGGLCAPPHCQVHPRCCLVTSSARRS